ncbi:MAG: radical SAM family heme chaperone HemW, partial [Promicromonosporaceae bacterium]|nr:radical SAM family heme chaperone HemW [Promicromonosporaceae bacterium]
MFSVYVHVPFCARRCGYCDFNTYTAKELGGGATQAGYPGLAIQEIDLAAEHLRAVGSEPREVDTVFFGGGTPTILPSSSLLKILKHIDRTWGLAPNAEITTEANPDSVTERSINELAAGGITRISLGMQSAVPHVLRTLDRTHDPEQVARAVGWAKAAGLAVSLDLIYGTPGESLTDWKRSVEIALALDIPHLSAYALQVEPHTKMGRQIARGLLPAPDDDDAAAKYELADSLFAEAGLEWYEISNWAKGGINGPNACRHNLAYWRGQSWWGFGPGSHSYLAPAQPNLPLPSPPHSPPSV